MRNFFKPDSRPTIIGIIAICILGCGAIAVFAGTIGNSWIFAKENPEQTCLELAQELNVANARLRLHAEALRSASNELDRYRAANGLYVAGSKRWFAMPVLSSRPVPEQTDCVTTLTTTMPDVLKMFRGTVGNPALMFENQALASTLATEVLKMVEADQPTIDAVLKEGGAG